MYIQLLATALMIGLAFWKRDIFIYFITFPVVVTFGVEWFQKYETPAGFTFSLVMFALGFYCFVLACKHLIGRFSQ